MRGLQLDLAWQKRVLRERTNQRQGGALVAGDLEAKQNTVGLIVAQQGDIRVRAGIARKIEHDIEAGARPERDGPVHGLEGFARLPIDRQNHRRDPVEGEHHEPRIGHAQNA